MKFAEKLARIQPHSHAPTAIETLGRVVVDLDLLNHKTEQDFLRIGGKLAEFMEAVDSISTKLAALANPEQGQRASKALTDALDRSTTMSESLGARGNGLVGIGHDVHQLRRTLSEFETTVSTFETLGLLTRIETARIGKTGTDFIGLADDVKLSASRISSRVENALEIVDSLIHPIEEAIRQISLLEEGESKDLHGLICGAMASLTVLRGIQDKTYESSLRLGVRSNAISTAFRKLIVSIQFHDITRQQVEHVVEVLQRLLSKSGGFESSLIHSPQAIAGLTALQSAQLADASEKFIASALSVEKNLESIAGLIVQMADESRVLCGHNSDGNGSLFEQMEQDCGAILSSFGHTATAEVATLATRKDLAESIGRMREPIEDIQKIEVQICRVALNARISAFHLGVNGRVLDALAGSVQELASECRERSESLVGSIITLTEATSISSQVRPSSAGIIAVNQDGCMQELREAVAELHSSDEQGFSRATEIVTCGERLDQDLSATRANFSVCAIFEDAVNQARGMLNEIGGGHQLDSSASRATALNLNLADCAANYTMQAERDIHEGFIRALDQVSHGVVPQHELTNEALRQTKEAAKAAARSKVCAVTTTQAEESKIEAPEAADPLDDVEFF
jgi:hypothetical protein